MALELAPYGYILNKQQGFEIVADRGGGYRTIFKLYLDGWGYKKIANYLTDNNVPTPRMSSVSAAPPPGSLCPPQDESGLGDRHGTGILDNDFYIGTLRQGKVHARENQRQRPQIGRARAPRL